MKTKKIIKRILLAIIILIISFICFTLYQTKDDLNITLYNIDKKLSTFYNQNKMGGFAVSVFNADSIIYSKGFGFADKESQNPYTTKTEQYIASISKTSIGIALLKAEELKLLSIDDPINEHLPFRVRNPHFPSLDITIKQLATHTSSLDYNEPVVESLYLKDTNQHKTMEAFMLDYFQDGKYGDIAYTDKKPGSDWNYSNIASALAAFIIERVSGMSFSDFSQKYIFDPLDLSHTKWFKEEQETNYHSSYYKVEKDSIRKIESSGIILYPCRDLITNVEELSIYCQAILSNNPILLNRRSYNKLLSPQLDHSVTNMSEDNNGLFFMIDRNNYGITYQLTGMDGGDSGIKTMMWFDPKTKLGYIFIGNTGGEDLNRLNHIFIYQSLVSLGHNYLMEHSSLVNKIKFKWHNLYSRLSAIF